MSDARTQQSNSPSGTIVDSDTFTYDDAGRMLTAVSGRYSNTVTYTYDDAGRKATEALTISGKTYTVSLEYDAKGQLIEYTYPDGTDVDRTYTDRGELYQVKYDGTTIDTRTYDNGGRMTGSSYNNGVSETRAYNNDNTLASISFSGASIGNMTYGWDDNKNKTSESITGTMSGYGFSVGGSGYDDEDRLVNFNRTDGNLDQSWSLSEVGDWDSVTTEGSTQTRTHGPSHELTAGGGGSISHDVKGNMTLIPSQLRPDSTALALNWDMDNRLNTADVGNNSSVDVTYKFDALGRRVYRDDGTDTTIFFQSGQQTIADYASGAAATAPLYNYVYASYIDEPVYRDEPSGSDDVYFHRNQQYSIVALTSAAGSIVERYAYSAYGIPTIATAGGMVLTSTLHDNRYLYTGREWDEDLNLYHYRARMYDPELGRFCSKDPIGYADSYNRYQGLMTVNGRDPTGWVIAKGTITPGKRSSFWFFGGAFPKDPFSDPLYSASAWLDGSPDKTGCKFSPPPIADMSLPRSVEMVGDMELVSGVVSESGPDLFEVEANKNCCCEKVQCARYYLHASIYAGWGLEVTGEPFTVTFSEILFIHDVWFNLAICADGTASVETVFHRELGDDNFIVGFDLNANGRKERFKSLIWSGNIFHDPKAKTSPAAWHIGKNGKCISKEWLVPPVKPMGDPIPYEPVDPDTPVPGTW